MKKEIQEGRKLKESLEERLQFEKLLSEISSEYANLAIDDVDQTISHGLERIGKFLGARRCTLAQYPEQKNTVRIVHSWGAKGVGPLPNFRPDASKFYPWTVNTLKKGQVVQFSRLEDLPEEAAVDKKHYEKVGTTSTLAVPIAVGGFIVGGLAVETFGPHRTWPEDLIQRIRLIGEIFVNAVVRKQKELEVQRAFQEISSLKEQLEADCSYLREEIGLEYNAHNMIGQSEMIRDVFQKIQQIASTDTTVLILGETGTGKELVARAIHDASHRKDRPMVKVNCAALPANLIESELFGHEKGAFTSAQAKHIGRFELANGSTIFLDEIGELPLESQAKLLRVLQEEEFERVGSARTIKVNVRIIAATNRDLQDEIKKGRFRMDLWYRLNVFPITVPPLRYRKEDIPLLANWLMDKFSRKLGKTIKRVPADVMQALQSYHWPGNVRELENVIERAAISTQGTSLRLLDNLVPARFREDEHALVSSLAQTERDHIIRVLEETNWKISGPNGAASLLELNPSTLRSKIKKLGIQRSNRAD